MKHRYHFRITSLPRGVTREWEKDAARRSRDPQTSEGFETTMVPILRDAGLSDLLAGDPVETLAGGFEFTEGPLWLPDGTLLFQDEKAGRTCRIGPDGVPATLRERTRGANGQTFGPDGRIIFCEQDGRRLSRMEADGSGVETVVETWSGRRLNSPNDIVCRSDGLVYFTDPPYGVKPEDRELHFQGLFALDTRGSLRLLADDFEKPNGLAFSPDERTLYVNDTARYQVRAFAVEPSGSLAAGSSRIFARPDPETPGGPDGLKVDRDGRVYVAVAQGIWVYAPDGRLLGIIGLPKRPANLAWCDPDARALAITAQDTVYRVRLKVAGVMPPFMPRPA
jgi:gluconolactonase